MKRSEIVVGRLYGHLKHPNAIYMGTGRTNLCRANFAKGLVIIKGDMKGTQVELPQNCTNSPDFWDHFYPLYNACASK